MRDCGGGHAQHPCMCFSCLLQALTAAISGPNDAVRGSAYRSLTVCGTCRAVDINRVAALDAAMLALAPPPAGTVVAIDLTAD